MIFNYLSSFDWIKNKTWPFHAFRKILISYSRFSNTYDTHLQESLARVCSEHFEMFDFQQLEISQTNIFRNGIGISSCIIWSDLVGPRIKIIGCGSRGHVHTARTSWTWGVFWISHSEFGVFGPLFSWNLQTKMAPQTPQTPNPDFARFFRISASVLLKTRLCLLCTSMPLGTGGWDAWTSRTDHSQSYPNPKQIESFSAPTPSPWGA